MGRWMGDGGWGMDRGMCAEEGRTPFQKGAEVWEGSTSGCPCESGIIT